MPDGYFSLDLSHCVGMLKLLAFLATSLLLAAPSSVAAQNLRALSIGAENRPGWTIEAIDGQPVTPIANQQALLRFETPSYGAFSCGMTVGDFAIADGRIVFRGQVTLSSIRNPSTARAMREGEAAFDCDTLLSLDHIDIYEDHAVIWGEDIDSSPPSPPTPRYRLRRVELGH